MHPMLNIAVKAARRAGQIINRGALDLEGVHVSTKQSHDYVTEIDQAAEEAIIEILQTSFPHHGILAEESGQARSESEYQWIIDPLDGTTNFIHGFPQYAVSIALRHKGILTQGVVFDPNRNELFTASRGKGAFLNERRIRVASRANFGECLIGTGFPFRAFDRIDHYLAILKELTRLTSGIRRPGAAALDLAWVACGRIDGFWEYGLSPWDMAAGALLISEAGGLVGDWQGEQNHLEKGEVVAANPKIFAHLLRVLTQAGRQNYTTNPHDVPIKLAP